MDCIFCSIIKGEIPSKIVYEDDFILAFEDINPLAPVHILIIPKEHIVSADDFTEDNIAVTSKIFLAAKNIAAAKGIDKTGYRIITNIGNDGGQVVKHLHFHLLGGRTLNGQLG